MNVAPFDSTPRMQHILYFKSDTSRVNAVRDAVDLPFQCSLNEMNRTTLVTANSAALKRYTEFFLNDAANLRGSGNGGPASNAAAQCASELNVFLNFLYDPPKVRNSPNAEKPLDAMHRMWKRGT